MNNTPLIVNGRPRYGRLSHAPSVINLDDFAYFSPFDKPLSAPVVALKRRFGFKSFQFISINNSDVMMGVAIVDLGWVGNGFFYIYDKRKQTVVEFSYLQPLARRTQIELPSASANSFFFKRRLQHQHEVR